MPPCGSGALMTGHESDAQLRASFSAPAGSVLSGSGGGGGGGDGVGASAGAGNGGGAFAALARGDSPLAGGSSSRDAAVQESSSRVRAGAPGDRGGGSGDGQAGGAQ
jgi:hypothetical protein